MSVISHSVVLWQISKSCLALHLVTVTCGVRHSLFGTVDGVVHVVVLIMGGEALSVVGTQAVPCITTVPATT